LIGDNNSAYRYLKAAHAYSEDLEPLHLKANMWTISGLISLSTGDPSVFAIGIEQAEKGITMFSQTDYGIFWECFLILAKLHFACEHEDEVIVALEKALEALGLDGDFLLIPPETLFSFASGVYRDAQPEEAEKYLRKAFERIMLVSGKIKDEELRQSYLENVLEIPKVIQEARARGWLTA